MKSESDRPTGGSPTLNSS